MVNNLMSILRMMLRLWRNNARMDLMWFLRDTRVCLVCIATEFILTLSTITGLFLLAERFGGLGGFTRNELLLMLGFGLCVDGLVSVFFGNQNTSAPSRRFGRGQIDNMMIQPVPIWMQLLTDGFLPVTGCASLIAGVIMTGIALRLLSFAVSAAWLGLFFVQLISSMGVMIGFLFLTAAPAFYAQVAAEEVSTTVNDFFTSIKQFPLGALPLWGRVLLATLLPAGLTAWLPTAALVGQAPAWTAFVTPAMAALFIALAVLTTRKGWKHYAKVGASRYSGRGFRN